MAESIGFGTAESSEAAPLDLRVVRWFRRACRERLAYPLLAAAAGGYSLVAFELSLAGARPMPEPFLRIADRDFFFWATFFYGPVIVAAWLLASSAIYVITWMLGVKPGFDRLLTATALASSVGTFGTLIPDLITSPLRALALIEEQAWEQSIATQGPWFWFTWATLVTYVLLFGIGYSLAVKQVTATSWPRSIAVGLAGFVAFQGFELLFIR